VLNAAREIDERALLHVEQVMIRTTRETMEPFSANKLVQSLIKEAGLSKDAAQKLASEVEHFVMSHEGLYLTTPLVREMASYLLLVNGREEERYRFAKLGISAWDLESALSAGGGLQNALRMAGQRALRERELFSLYPKDVVDAHLDGELNLREVGTTSLAPDHVSVPLKSLGGSLERLLSLALSTRVELSIVVPGGRGTIGAPLAPPERGGRPQILRVARPPQRGPDGRGPPGRRGGDEGRGRIPRGVHPGLQGLERSRARAGVPRPRGLGHRRRGIGPPTSGLSWGCRWIPSRRWCRSWGPPSTCRG
jgi:hypothetical protein